MKGIFGIFLVDLTFVEIYSFVSMLISGLTEKGALFSLYIEAELVYLNILFFDLLIMLMF